MLKAAFLVNFCNVLPSLGTLEKLVNLERRERLNNAPPVRFLRICDSNTARQHGSRPAYILKALASPTHHRAKRECKITL